MPEAISIDAFLKLKTEDAVKQLAAIGKNQQPVTIPVKFDAQKIGSSFAEITASAIGSKLKSSFNTIGDDLVTKIEDAFSKTKIKTKGGGLLGGLTNIVTAPLQGLTRGAFEGVGRQISSNFGAGLSKGLESQLSQFVGNTELLGEKLTGKLIPNLASNAIKSLKETKLAQALSDVIDKELDKTRNRKGNARSTERAIKDVLRELKQTGLSTNVRNALDTFLGSQNILIEQEVLKAATKKTRSRKKNVAQKEVASQLVTELQQQPKLELKTADIDKQIAFFQQQSVKEKELIKRLQKVLNPSVKSLDAVKKLRRNLDTKNQQIAELQFQAEIKKQAGEGTEAINKQIASLQQEADKEKQVIAKALKIYQNNLVVYKQIEGVKKSIEAKKNKISSLTQQRQQILAPVAQQKLQKLDIDTSNVGIEQERVDKATEALKGQIEKLDGQRKSNQKDIEFAREQITSLTERIERISKSLSAELLAQESLKGTNLFSLDTAQVLSKKLKEAKTKVEIFERAIPNAEQNIAKIDSRIAKRQELIDNAFEEKLVASLRAQIDIIQRITQKSATQITKTIAIGQQRTLDRALVTAQAQAEQRLAVINSTISKGSSISESTIAKGEQEVAKSAVGKLIAKRKQAERSIQKLLKEKSQLTQQNNGKDTTELLKKLEEDLQLQIKELSVIRTKLTKVEEKSFSSDELDTKQNSIKTIIDNLQKQRSKLIARQFQGENVDKLLISVEDNLKNRVKELKELNAEINKEAEKNYDNLQLSRFLEVKKVIASNAKKAAASLEKAQENVTELEARAKQEVDKLTARTQGLIASLKPLVQQTTQQTQVVVPPAKARASHSPLQSSEPVSSSPQQQAIASTAVKQEQEKALAQARAAVYSGLDNLVSQVKPIELPKAPAVSSRAFPVIDNSRQLQQLLEKQISASGLKELVKRLGLGTDSLIKKVAIERIVNSYKQDALKVQELIARFGDDIRLKAAKAGANSSFGSLEDEPALTEAFKVNQKVLRQAYDRLGELPREQQQTLAKKLNAITQGQIETIDRLTREFKISGKTAQSLSGTRSQLANINDSVINITKGVAVGTKKEAANVEKQGHEMGESFNKGFRESQGIKSPATERIKDMKNVALGVAIGVEHNIRRAVKAGKRLGNSVSDGFLKSNIAKGKIADRAARQIEKQVKKLEKQNQKAAKATIGRIKKNLQTAEQIISSKSKQFDRARQQKEVDDARKVTQTQARIFKNRGIGDPPLTVNEEPKGNGNLIDSLKSVIASIQNDLRKSGLAKANKEAERVVIASKDLLSRLKTSVTIGRDAASKIRQANKAIARLERQQAKAIKNIDSLKAADKRKVKAQVNRIQEQIQEERERIAALKAQRTEAKKLLPVYRQLTKLNQQLQKAIANRDLGGIRRLNREINQVFSKVNQPPPAKNGGLLGAINKQLSKIGITSKSVLRTLKGLAALAVGSIFVGGLDDVARQISEVNIRFEQLETQINFAAGSVQKGAENFAFASSEARRLKVDLEQAIKGYASLSAATRNSEALQGQTQEIFRVITQASRVTGATAQQTEAAFLAIQQMVSGGTLQLEELRQLGESGGIKGVFDIAQKALGAADGELKKLISTGTIAVDDFLPKFIKQLDRVTRNGVADSLNTISANLTKVQNEFKLLQVEIGKASRETTKLTLRAVAKGLELVRSNLHLILPVVKTTATLLAIAILPTALKLGKLLTGLIVKGLGQIITLLGVTNTQLLATNAQLTFLANVSPGMARLIGTLNKLQVALKLVAAAAKVLIIFEAISSLAGSWYKTAQAGQEVRNSINQIEDAVKKLKTTLATQSKGSLLPEELTRQIADQNKQRLKDNQHYFQKFTDNFKHTVRKVAPLADKLFGKNVLLSFEEAQLSRIQAATGDAIAANQKLLQDADNQLGLGDLTDEKTEELQAYADAVDNSNTALQATLQQSVDPNQINSLNREIAENEKRLDRYNQELERRQGLELTLAKIVLEAERLTGEAQREEVESINRINKEILLSGELKKDTELDKLKLTQTRIDKELKAEQEALGKIKTLADKEGVDKDGIPNGLNKQETEQYKKKRDRIVQLEKEKVENMVALANKESELTLKAYDDYLAKLENKAGEAVAIATTAEKERLLEIEELQFLNLINAEKAEEMKLNVAARRIRTELQQEKDKLAQLRRFNAEGVEAEEKLQKDIRASRDRTLDLSLQLLQQEKQAEEKTVEAITSARNKQTSVIDNLISAQERLNKLSQAQADLTKGRNDARTSLAQLEITNLKRALEIRRQLDSGDIAATERKALAKELANLGIKGRTNELAILARIEKAETRLVKIKQDALLKQQQRDRESLAIENEKLRLTTLKAAIEAQQSLNQANRDLIESEAAIAAADNSEEQQRAIKLNQLSQLQVNAAKQSLHIANRELSLLDLTIARKRENLNIQQQIARAELDSTVNTEKYARALEVAKVRADNLNLLSRDEKIEQAVDTAREKGGESFTDADEQKLRTKLDRLIQGQERQQELLARQEVLGKKGFTIEAPSDFLQQLGLISQEKQVDRSLVLQTVGNTQPKELNLILQTLKNIESQSLKAPIQQENTFINQFDRNDERDLLRKVRSQTLEDMREILLED